MAGIRSATRLTARPRVHAFGLVLCGAVAIAQEPEAAVPGERGLRMALEFARDTADFQSDKDVHRLFEMLARPLEQGYPRPSRLPAEAVLQPLLNEPSLRSRLSRLLRDHAREAEVRIGSAREPGRPLSMRIRFTGAESEPAAKALVFLYQADARGYYAPEAEEPGAGNRNPRLFAWLRTDAEGRIAVRTVLPGSYGGAPPHFHVSVVPVGTQKGARTGGSLYLEGDWPMDEEVYSDAEAGVAWVLPVVEREEGYHVLGTLRLR